MFKTKTAHWGARSGVLAINGKEIITPNFIIATTRGAVPHLTPDHQTPTPVVGIYAEELWDAYGLASSCIDRETLPFHADLVLATARRPGSRSITNKANTADCLGIDTFQGSRLASISEMVKFMSLIRPDVFVVPYDIPSQSKDAKVGRNRIHKMATRSADWLERFYTARAEHQNTLLVASVPQELADSEYIGKIDPHCDAYTFTSPEAEKAVQHIANPSKMRLSNRTTTDWREVLEEIAKGSDLVYIPLTQYADAGKALTLTFKADTPEYMDLNDSKYETDMSVLGKTGHHLAYIHHLLNAEEMTAQVLLQMHNHAIVTKLFEDVQESIKNGTFERDYERFVNTYY